MKRLITILLLTAMLLSCFAMSACNQQGNEERDTSSQTESNGGESNNPTTAKDLTKLDVPKDLSYDGDSFIIKTYTTSIPEYCDQNTERPDTVEAALIERDLFTQEYLGVDLVYDITTKGNYPEREEFSDAVRQSVNGGLRAFDMIGAYFMVPPNLTLEGLLVDMNTLDYIDFDKAWYPQFMLDTCTIMDQTYFMTGDISTQSLFRMLGVVFSESLAAQNGISEDELYRMVYDGDWTYDNWFAMCEDLARELDGDGQWDAGDFYPIQTSASAHIDAFYPSAGLSVLNTNENGKLQVSPDMTGEKTLNFYQMVYDAEHTYHIYKDSYDEKLILNKKCIFQICPLGNFRLEFKDATESYRVLPMPKYEAEKDVPYRTWLASYMLFAIPTDIKDPNRSAAVFETMSYAGYTYLVPAIFEKTFKLHYSPTENVANMYDIMRDGRISDIAATFTMTFHAFNYNDVSAIFRYNVQKNVTNWVTVYKENYEVGLHYVCRVLNEFYAREER